MIPESRPCVATVAFPFPVGTTGYGLTMQMIEICRQHNLIGSPAKMGPHATILPPFRCLEHEIRGMAAMARLVWDLNGREYKTRVTGVGTFGPSAQNSTVGALYLALEMPEGYRRSVERHKTNWPFEFVYASARANATDRVWNPHLSIIEGPFLHEVATPLLPTLNEYAENRIVTIGEPLIFVEKKEAGAKWWDQVHV